jgi:UDP-3-O-[3-hydroxymyristoyl] glucosamine N-acyltransferase
MFDETEWNNVDDNFIHKTAVINKNVILGKGNIVYPYCVIGFPGFIRNFNNDVKKIIIGSNNKIGCFSSIMSGNFSDTIIGNNNIIMNYVNIGHDVFIGDDNEIGANVIIAGYVSIGNLNKIKISSSIRNRLSIKNNNIIGMGSVLTKNIESNFLLYGNPAKIISNIKSN